MTGTWGTMGTTLFVLFLLCDEFLYALFDAEIYNPGRPINPSIPILYSYFRLKFPTVSLTLETQANVSGYSLRIFVRSVI